MTPTQCNSLAESLFCTVDV